MPQLLVIDDDEAIVQTLALHFGQLGFEVFTASDSLQGLAQVDSHDIDVVISDINMPGQDGLWLLEKINENHPGIPVIMITAFHDLDNTVAAMHGGAVDFVPKPIDLEELENAIERALKAHQKGNVEDDALVMGDDYKVMPRGIVGSSRSMQNVFRAVAMVSQSPVSVLLLGESGTGKERVSRAVHDASPQSGQPFVAVNCAALVETLLESELFGHERGAFTGAVSAHKGKVEVAGEGTLFLDEIAEMSMAMQGKLLRLLEEREYSPVGSTKIKTSKARFIAATNVDLKERVEEGRFREDLYYRINVFSISIPPLRERREDISLLVRHLLAKINAETQKNICRVPLDVMNALNQFDWPGNVRELENVLLKACVLSTGDTLQLSNLPPELISSSNGEDLTKPQNLNDTAQLISLKELEYQHICRVLACTGWHKGKSCEILGVSRPRLERRINEFGINKENCPPSNEACKSSKN
ncbi:MAG: Fis family transcriptional regulator [Rhodospirillaceae bacterium]|nr:MAG: Fis family transcriptional regulator [Rhodospirillaceae bacterium]